MGAYRDHTSSVSCCRMMIVILLLLLVGPATAEPGLIRQYFPSSPPPTPVSQSTPLAPTRLPFSSPSPSATTVDPLPPMATLAPSSAPSPSPPSSSILLFFGGLALSIAVGASFFYLVHLRSVGISSPLSLGRPFTPASFATTALTSLVEGRTRQRLMYMVALRLPDHDSYRRSTIVSGIVEDVVNANLSDYEKALLPHVFLSFVLEGRPFEVFTDVLNILRLGERGTSYSSALMEMLKDMDRANGPLASVCHLDRAWTLGRFFGKLFVLETLPLDALGCMHLSRQALTREPNYGLFLKGFFEEITVCFHSQASLEAKLMTFFDGDSLADFMIWSDFIETSTTCTRVRDALLEVLSEAVRRCETSGTARYPKESAPPPPSGSS